MILQIDFSPSTYAVINVIAIFFHFGCQINISDFHVDDVQDETFSRNHSSSTFDAGDVELQEMAKGRQHRTGNGTSNSCFFCSETISRWRDLIRDRLFWILREQEEASAAAPCHLQPHPERGQEVIVHLFEWRWLDVADECERFLAPKGFAAVQVSPPNENGIVWEPYWNPEVKRPWFERYRPVSYILKTRSGSAEDFDQMLKRCNAVGVNVYADAVLNHMTFHDDPEVSTAGSPFDSETLNYEAVSYGPSDFNSKVKCGTASGDIEDFQDVFQLRNCRLLGLNDLNQRKEHVRTVLTSYLNGLIRLGVAGFRLDAAKHMWPQDLAAILERLHFLNSSFFPVASRPFIYQEVVDLAEDPISSAEYTRMGRVTEFKFGIQLAKIFNPSPEDSSPLYDLRYLSSSPGFLKSHNALVFVDNHDTQRGHGPGADHKVLTFRAPQSYVLAVVFMLAWPYGVPCLMSSYDWTQDWVQGKDRNDWVGPPHYQDWKTSPVEYDAAGRCTGGWICEHRWHPIAAMVLFRNVAGQSSVSHWWQDGDDQVAFGRSGRGFLAISRGGRDLSARLQTGLPPGYYCDVLRERGDECVLVDARGEANIYVPAERELTAVAYRVVAR